MKFQDLCAIVGGFMKIIMMIFALLNSPLNQFNLEMFLINEFFECDVNSNIANKRYYNELLNIIVLT